MNINSNISNGMHRARPSATCGSILDASHTYTWLLLALVPTITWSDTWHCATNAVRAPSWRLNLWRGHTIKYNVDDIRWILNKFNELPDPSMCTGVPSVVSHHTAMCHLKLAGCSERTPSISLVSLTCRYTVQHDTCSHVHQILNVRRSHRQCLIFRPGAPLQDMICVP